jgi:hypothetical protein
VGDGALGGALPGEAFQDAGAAGGTEAGPQLRVVEEAPEGGGEGAGVARRDLPGGTARQVSPSGPATSGMAPPVVATSGVPVAMASAAGSEKPS